MRCYRPSTIGTIPCYRPLDFGAIRGYRAPEFPTSFSLHYAPSVVTEKAVLLFGFDIRENPSHMSHWPSSDSIELCAAKRRESVNNRCTQSCRVSRVNIDEYSKNMWVSLNEKRSGKRKALCLLSVRFSL